MFLGRPPSCMKAGGTQGAGSPTKSPSQLRSPNTHKPFPIPQTMPWINHRYVSESAYQVVERRLTRRTTSSPLWSHSLRFSTTHANIAEAHKRNQRDICPAPRRAWWQSIDPGVAQDTLQSGFNLFQVNKLPPDPPQIQTPIPNIPHPHHRAHPKVYNTRKQTHPPNEAQISPEPRPVDSPQTSAGPASVAVPKPAFESRAVSSSNSASRTRRPDS